MSTIPAGPAEYSARASILTLAAIGVVACASADMIHEVLGHVLAAWLVDDRIVSLSTVAIQTVAPDRFVAAAGTAANLFIGTLALALFSRSRRRTGWGYFLWVFAAFNLLNSGYLVVSAILGNGDWAVVIGGLSPSWAWRAALGFAGAMVYALGMHWLARSMVPKVESGQVALWELRRLTVVSYLAGGAILTAAAFFNPIGPQLILLAGVGASFGLSWGLLLIPRLIQARVQGDTQAALTPMPLSPVWLGLALV